MFSRQQLRRTILLLWQELKTCTAKAWSRYDGTSFPEHLHANAALQLLCCPLCVSISVGKSNSEPALVCFLHPALNLGVWCWGGMKMGFPPVSFLYGSWQASQDPVTWNAQAGEQTFVGSGSHCGGILVLLLNCGYSSAVKCKDWSDSKTQRSPLEHKSNFEKAVCVISHLLLLLNIVILHDSKLNAGWISYFNVVVCKVLS